MGLNQQNIQKHCCTNPDDIVSQQQQQTHQLYALCQPAGNRHSITTATNICSPGQRWWGFEEGQHVKNEDDHPPKTNTENKAQMLHF